MEAKDTVMNIEQREVFRTKCHKAVAVYLGKDMPNIRLSDMDGRAIQICRDVAREELEAQAQITWDKAVREVVEWINVEVFGNSDGYVFNDYDEKLNHAKWQAKLKEWGIE